MGLAFDQLMTANALSYFAVHGWHEEEHGGSEWNMATSGRMQGKVAIITGAANGIGRAAATLFASEGAALVLVDVQEAQLQDLAGQLSVDCETICGDVSDERLARNYVAAAVGRHGKVDVALLNAGIEGFVGPIGISPLESFDRVMAVNVRGVWLGLSAVMPAMMDLGGSIVITSSAVGLKAGPFLAPYTASKHAIVGLMRSAAVEGAPHGIRVNSVHPGPVDTRLLEGIESGRNPSDPEAARRAGIGRVPLGRVGRPEEVAAMMLFLAGDESSFCTGGTHVVDGGWLS